MSKTLSASIATAVLTAALVAAVAAGADEPDARTTTGYYLRGKTFVCTEEVVNCNAPDVIVRCKAGDFATGGAAWIIDRNPGPYIVDHLDQPWRKNGAARGWLARGRGIGPDDEITVQVICARQG